MGATNNFDYRAFIAEHGGGPISKYRDGSIVYAQGSPADALYYIVSGSTAITVTSKYGKEAVIALLTAGDFFGEEYLSEQPLRPSTVITKGDCQIVRIEKTVVVRALNNDASFSKLFTMFIVNRSEGLKLRLIVQMFNSSEQRLAITLLTLANPNLRKQSDVIPIPINQETLARMVGTTRGRINKFMNKFRSLGYIDYNGKIEVRRSLLNIVFSNHAVRN